MALSAGRAACACNATVVMIDLDNECPGPDVARALGRTREKKKGQAPHAQSWPFSLLAFAHEDQRRIGGWPTSLSPSAHAHTC
jgi:hypothetical protein